MLCTRCSTLASLVNSQKDVIIDHYETGTELDNSAGSGCRLCQVISRARNEKYAGKHHASPRIKLKLIRDAGIQLSLTEDSAQGNTRAVTAYVVFGSYSLPNSMEDTLVKDDFDNTNTGSKSAFQLSAAWLDECLLTHIRCSQTIQAWPNAEPPLPHRIIDVGTADGPYVSLVDTRATRITGRYIALSHCWGGGSPIMTTSDNLASHVKGIRCDDLPPTFRDAVHATRNLGCRHLWIDSLCIIQDDKNDWEAEASMMSQYYQLALLTIAAADGSNSNAGLFRERNGPGYLPCPLPLGGGDDGRGRRVYAFTNELSSELKRSSLSSSYRPYSLDTRAWVFQEQVLSPRTLSFARDSVSWRCQEAVFDDRPPYYKDINEFINEPNSSNAIPHAHDPRAMAAVIAKLRRSWLLTPHQPAPVPGPVPNCGSSNSEHGGVGATPCFWPEDDFIIQWGNMVLEYTQRGLTYQTDKLVAIQGIADALVSIRHDPANLGAGKPEPLYYAGAWVQTNRATVLSLLWAAGRSGRRQKDSWASERRRDEGGQHERLEMVPSWSWASITYTVRWPGHLLHCLEPRLEVRQVCRGSTNPGELLVEANVKTGVLRTGTARDTGVMLCTIVHWTDTAGVGLDGTGAKEGGTPVPAPGPPVAVDGGETRGFSFMDEDLGVGGEEPWTVWLAEAAAGELHAVDPTLNKRQVHCLVLRKLRDGWEIRQGVEYALCKRVGYCVLDEDKWNAGSELDMRRVGLCIK